jgi:hypothetical protein
VEINDNDGDAKIAIHQRNLVLAIPGKIDYIVVEFAAIIVQLIMLNFSC